MKKMHISMHIMASVLDLGKCSANRGTSYAILYLECYPKYSKKLEMKRNDAARSSDTLYYFN